MPKARIIGALSVQSLTLLAGASVTDAFKLEGSNIGIVLPTVNVTAGISFAVCATVDGTFVPLFDSANAELYITVTASASTAGATAIGLKADAKEVLAPFQFAKIRMGKASAPKTYTADATITVVTK